MGCDTTILINNDMLSHIAEDTKFGAMVVEAIRALPASDGPVPIGYGAYAIESHHMDSITVFAVGGRQARILGGTPQEKDEKEIIRHLAAKHRLTLIETERLSELLKEPTTDEVERWLAKRGLQAVKKPSGEENGVEKNEAVQASPLLPLEEISRQAKEHGWRLVVCRRKVMPKQTTLRKKAR